MKSLNHKYLFFAESHKLLFSSLKRYFNYILNQKLNPFSATESGSLNKVLFVYQEEKENSELLNILVNNSNIEVVVIGYDTNSTINIVDLASLKNNFESELNNADFKPHQLFTVEELKEKLKNFFHSHGEDSLFECLNSVRYYLSNGINQFRNNEITFSDYELYFFVPGVKKWDYFLSRLLKYSNIIKLSNYSSTINELDEIVKSTTKNIQRLTILKDENIFNETDIFFESLIDNLKRIDNILIAFYRKLSFGQSSVQNTNS